MSQISEYEVGGGGKVGYGCDSEEQRRAEGFAGRRCGHADSERTASFTMFHLALPIL